jgi:hypothetical protein
MNKNGDYTATWKHATAPANRISSKVNKTNNRASWHLAERSAEQDSSSGTFW